MSNIKEALKQTFIGRGYLRYRDRAATRHEKMHHQAMLDFYRGLVSPGAMCFDVGANVGNRVAVFLELGAKVVAVEPQPGCISILEGKFQGHNGFTLVAKALGAEFGEAEMLQCETDTISSMSKTWIEAVKSSGRFSGYEWNKKMVVPVITLDSLIETHGSPDFIKIDVEGYEYEVVRGLTGLVKALSIEFTPEYLSNAFMALDHLEALGFKSYQFSVGETMKFHFADWVALGDIKAFLRTTVNDKVFFGDIYAVSDQFKNRSLRL